MRSTFSKFNATDGFTLIELSIVLVIIGLIVGGVLVGKDLINAAMIRKQLSQLQQLETAARTFQTKFGGLPGDTPNATSVFGTTDSKGYAIVNGDGDGTIRSTTGITDCVKANVGGEIQQLFLQLKDASLGEYASDGSSTAPGVGYPLVDYGTKGGLYVTCLTSNLGTFPVSSMTNFPSYGNLQNGNIIVAGTNPLNNGHLGYNLGINSTNTGGLPADVAGSIDVKVDDGNPNTGAVGAISNSTSNTSCFTGTTTYAAPSGCGVVLGKRMN